MADTLDMDEGTEEKEQPSVQNAHQNLLSERMDEIIDRFERVDDDVECDEYGVVTKEYVPILVQNQVDDGPEEDDITNDV